MINEGNNNLNYCTNCGNIIENGSTFCSKCGQTFVKYTQNITYSKPFQSVTNKTWVYYFYLILLCFIGNSIIELGIIKLAQWIFGFLETGVLNSITIIAILIILVFLTMLYHKILMEEIFRKSIVRKEELPKLRKYLLMDWWIFTILLGLAFLTNNIIFNIVLGIIGHITINKQFEIQVRNNY